ncbi:hypothetical protein HMPREF9056_01669 [Actinomyces sp. oral taxon 170 str. F0386]|nr:hypothetical protein HMPREF9056_01669 [Actinomyces sp. oral taxon 170 str. F0386]
MTPCPDLSGAVTFELHDDEECAVTAAGVVALGIPRTRPD